MLSAIISAAVVANAFDLHCTGVDTNRQAFAHDISVDLDRGAWCWREDRCEFLVKVASVEPGLITLAKNPSNTVTVNRTTGEFIKMTDGGSFRSTEVGTCERRPYTPLPENKF